MAEVDPETLLEWLSLGLGEGRDIQMLALEQLCMLLLMSDNVDKCFEMQVQIYWHTQQENILFNLNVSLPLQVPS